MGLENNMKIDFELREKKRYYKLTLNREEAERLSYGETLISPPARGGATFWVFGSPSVFEESFHPMPSDDPEGYAIYIGGLKIRGADDLIKLINERGEIPIEISGIEGKVNVGYVSFEFVDKFED